MISKRLQEISKYLNNYESLIDIGCDHGYLAYLGFNNYNIKKALLTDINQEPLNNAYNNLNNYHYNIEYLKTNGLNNVNTYNYDVLAISGMGSKLISNILIDSKDKLINFKRIILQPNNKPEVIRSILKELNLKIIDEEVIFEYKYYPIIVLENGFSDLNDEDIFLGPKLKFKKDKVTLNYYNFLLKTKLKIYLKSNNKEILKEIDFLKNTLNN